MNYDTINDGILLHEFPTVVKNAMNDIGEDILERNTVNTLTNSCISNKKETRNMFLTDITRKTCPPVSSHDMIRKGFYYIAADIAAIRGCPVFEIFLNASEEVFFLSDKQAGIIIDQCLYPCETKLAGNRIKVTLLSIFQQAFTSLEKGQSLKGMKEIIQFAFALSVGHLTIPYNENTLQTYEALFSSMDMIIMQLRSFGEECPDCTLADDYTNITTRAESVLASARNINEPLHRTILYQNILYGWDILKDMPCTYSALFCLTLLQDTFEDTAPLRYELFGLLKYSSFS